MPLVEFEPTISAGERAKTYALDRVATVTDTYRHFNSVNHSRYDVSCFPAIHCDS